LTASFHEAAERLLQESGADKATCCSDCGRPIPVDTPPVFRYLPEDVEVKLCGSCRVFFNRKGGVAALPRYTGRPVTMKAGWAGYRLGDLERVWRAQEIEDELLGRPTETTARRRHGAPRMLDFPAMAAEARANARAVFAAQMAAQKGMLH
jgi:hypothetical protein